MAYLPYHVVTEFGESFDVNLPLHEQTESAVRVAQLLSTILGALDKDITVMGETANGDVLQAVAMALAIRARIVPVPFDVSIELTSELLDTALAAVARVDAHYPTAGNA
ncbi:MAG: hypothetical protein ACE363_12710 [Alphaproteobacteria bacterium]